MFLELLGGIAIGASIAAILDALTSALDEQNPSEDQKQ